MHIVSESVCRWCFFVRFVHRRRVTLTCLWPNPIGNYGEELANVIQQVLLVAEVASLAMDLERGKDDDEIRKRASILNYNVRSSDGELPSYDIDSDTATASGAHDSMAQVGDRRDRYTGSFSQSQKNEFMDLLESWEEPETEKQRTVSYNKCTRISGFLHGYLC